MNTAYQTVEVVGAGPSGLAAAITLARSGQRVIVHEAQPDVGHRFGADLQGLENWSTQADVLDVLGQAGLTTGFEKLPCSRGIVFDAWGGEHEIRSAQPIFYMVERGPRRGSLDSALLAQALAVGVEVRFGSRKGRLEGPGVLAVGPKAADAIAVGYHFETDMPEGFWVILDDQVAPKGYAYLLAMGGRGTVKSCMFSGFKDERLYVERTIERFRSLVGLKMKNPRPHGGVGNFRVPGSAVSGGHPVAGEQAGFQDALAGFGMRYAMLSGVTAARSLLDAGDYDAQWRQSMQPLIEASIVNRAVYDALGNSGHRWALRGIERAADVRGFLRRLYEPARTRRLLLPWARRRFRSRREDASCNHIDCTCVWCRCGGEGATDGYAPSSAG